MRLRRALDELHVAGDAGSRRAYGGPDGRRTPAPAGPAGGDAPSAPPSRRNHPVIPGPSPTRFTVFADDSRALLRLLGLRPFAFSLTNVWI